MSSLLTYGMGPFPVCASCIFERALEQVAFIDRSYTHTFANTPSTFDPIKDVSCIKSVCN